MPKTLHAEQGMSGSACLIAAFCRIHLQLAMGQVVMLHSCRISDESGNSMPECIISIVFYAQGWHMLLLVSSLTRRNTVSLASWLVYF